LAAQVGLPVPQKATFFQFLSCRTSKNIFELGQEIPGSEQHRPLTFRGADEKYGLFGSDQCPFAESWGVKISAGGLKWLFWYAFRVPF